MTLPYEPAARLADRFLEERLVTRIWERDPAVWNAPPASDAARSIATRLGWLDVASTMAPHLERVDTLAAAAREERVSAVYLLGMGGSSLCAEVIRAVLGVGEGCPDIFVLDTTDERTLQTAAAGLDPARTLIVVASKSGTTVEVSSMERFFWAKMSAALGDRAGRQFIAITDPGTPLVSLFGLVPAALIGAPHRELLDAGAAMSEGCRQENHANAGLELGAFMGAAALAGRDKLTLILPPSLATLGTWVEQLVAESTGKERKGILPVVDEPLGRPEDYGQDRAFVAYTTDKDAPDTKLVAAVRGHGHPVLELTARVDGLGAEFFRWEFATAVAGAALGVNPFDEPNVSEAKAKTKAILDRYAKEGSLPEPQPLAADGDVAAITRAFPGGDPAAVVRAALGSLQTGDYVAFLSYLPPTPAVSESILGVRVAIRARKRVATTFGVGPRYLHSTGQYHKGGPNTVLAFVITADDETQTEIPEAGYSFAVLKRAQALGDVQTLEAHGRRVVHLHLKERDNLAAIARLFAAALK